MYFLNKSIKYVCNSPFWVLKGSQVEFLKYDIFIFLKIFLADPDEMRLIWHFIWVFTVCQSTCLLVSKMKRIKLMWTLHSLHQCIGTLWCRVLNWRQCTPFIILFSCICQCYYGSKVQLQFPITIQCALHDTHVRNVAKTLNILNAHIKGRLMIRAVILINCKPFHKTDIS